MSQNLFEEGDLCALHRALAGAGLVHGRSGNASMCDDDRGKILIKASGVRCGEVTPGDLVLIDARTFEVLAGPPKPSTDCFLHAAVYNAVSDARFVVHTHSKDASTFSALGRTLVPILTGSAEIFGDGVPCIPFSADRAQLSRFIEGVAGRAPKALLLERHGTLCWGSTWTQAIEVAELLEWSASVAMAAAQLGIAPMSASQIEEYAGWYQRNYPEP